MNISLRIGCVHAFIVIYRSVASLRNLSCLGTRSFPRHSLPQCCAIVTLKSNIYYYYYSYLVK
jgi:hypothetical protein